MRFVAQSKYCLSFPKNRQVQGSKKVINTIEPPVSRLITPTYQFHRKHRRYIAMNINHRALIVIGNVITELRRVDHVPISPSPFARLSTNNQRY